MKHKITIVSSSSHTVSADCLCGDWSFYRNLYAARGYKTRAIESARYEYRLHKNGDKMTQESMSWGEIAELTHVTQVQKFDFCMCEDNEGKENPYKDCPVS